MSVELASSDLRAAITTTISTHESDPAARVLHALFAEVYAELIGSDPERSAFYQLLGLERDRAVWSERLLDACYKRSLGPRLARHKGHLQAATPMVLEFWQATRQLTDWLVDEIWRETERSPALTADELRALFRPNPPKYVEIKAPGWSDSVRLLEPEDGLLRIPASDGWVAVELGIEPAAPEPNLQLLALAELFRSGAAATSAGTPERALHIVRFSPQRSQLTISGESLERGRDRLLKTIAELTQVGASARPVSTPAPSTAAVTERTSEDYARLAERLTEAYREYGKKVLVEPAPQVGPRFLRFDARLGKGVRYEQFKSLTPEVGLRLGLTRDPIVSRAGGRLTIDVVRPDPESVPFASLAGEFEAPDELHGSSRLLVGVGIDGRCRFADLADPVNAHVLVAGTTGSGKTEWLRSALASLIVSNTPATLRLLLMDPKQTAFGELKSSPYLWAPYGFWIPGNKLEAADVLTALEAEMERRYKLLAEARVDDLRRYREKTRTRLPRIVMVCDEYYALLGQSGKEERKEIERAIAMLGAKARAAGIHMILAMQQASRKIIQGSIDTNIPCRVALRTQSAIESRMVLQADGSDQLTGYGDLLYKDIGEPVRLQGPLLDAEERLRLFAGQSTEKVRHPEAAVASS